MFYLYSYSRCREALHDEQTFIDMKRLEDHDMIATSRGARGPKDDAEGGREVRPVVGIA